MSLQQPLFIGIDGGGTKCKVRIENSQRQVIGEGQSGPANPVRSVEVTIDSIVSATYVALQQAQLPETAIRSLVAGIGLAGVNLPKYNDIMQRWQHPFQKMYLTTDLHIACLGAHNGEDGAVIIAGTGSSGVAVNAQQCVEIGGHGLTVGDKGSGAWLGAQAITQCLEVLDGIADDSILVPQVLQHFSANNGHTLVEAIIGATPAVYARLAPLIIKNANENEPLALSIVQQGAEYLSRMAKRLLQENPQRLSLIGGLAEPMRPWLDADVQQFINSPILAPECGAILYARQQFQSRETQS
ncbi:BadF/BadG/BcrA/BcrD ATPase family protein [Alteromonadaceae bacterium BrNp21-10]|nr:BadF/BadG/BcrA/BcrD ATPase family protein [Alteromonadaceae bacterium BrNp21-10]